MPTVFFLILEGPKLERKIKGVTVEEKTIEISGHLIPAKEEKFVFLSFVFFWRIIYIV